MKTIVKAHGWTGFESVEDSYTSTLALASMLLQALQPPRRGIPCRASCLFMSLFSASIKYGYTSIHSSIYTMQCSKEIEDFPLHEQLLAAGRDYCTVPID